MMWSACSIEAERRRLEKEDAEREERAAFHAKYSSEHPLLCGLWCCRRHHGGTETEGQE